VLLSQNQRRNKELRIEDVRLRVSRSPVLQNQRPHRWVGGGWERTGDAKGLLDRTENGNPQVRGSPAGKSGNWEQNKDVDSQLGSFGRIHYEKGTPVFYLLQPDVRGILRNFRKDTG